MKFGSAGGSKPKAWKDIWGAGQGVGGITELVPVAKAVAQLRDEYETARLRITKAN